ncbi:MAG: tryptophan-rich sensory protein [Elainellaceae cyanobacterium]
MLNPHRHQIIGIIQQDSKRLIFTTRSQPMSPRSSFRPRLRPIVTAGAVLAAFLVNVWANVAPINGQTIGDISNQQFGDILMTPESYAFAIWGLIYVGLFVLAAYQLRPAQQDNPRLQSTYWLAAACLAQMVWVFLFLTGQFVASLVAMVAILLALLVFYQRLRSDSRASDAEKWRSQRPVSLYLGWISVATVLNVAIALDSAGWRGWGIPPVMWTVLMVLVAASLGGLVLWRYADWVYPGVVVWALVAIAVRHSSRPLLGGIAAGSAGLLTLLMGWRYWRYASGSRQHRLL